MNRILLIVLVIAVIASAALNVYLGFAYRNALQALGLARRVADIRTVNNKTLDFTKLVVDKVLHADQGINFEDRLRLENEARGLDSAAILGKWNDFVQSKTQEEAQNNLRDLLSFLINNIRPE